MLDIRRRQFITKGHEVQLALAEAPEIRQKLHHKDGYQDRSQRRHLANP